MTTVCLCALFSRLLCVCEIVGCFFLHFPRARVCVCVRCWHADRHARCAILRAPITLLNRCVCSRVRAVVCKLLCAAVILIYTHTLRALDQEDYKHSALNALKRHFNSRLLLPSRCSRARQMRRDASGRKHHHNHQHRTYGPTVV